MATINFNASEVEPSQELQPLPEGRYEAVVASFPCLAIASAKADRAASFAAIRLSASLRLRLETKCVFSNIGTGFIVLKSLAKLTTLCHVRCQAAQGIGKAA